MRRGFVRFVRRLRRPTFGRLVVASVLVHAGLVVLAVWLGGGIGVTPLPRPAEPLVVELPPAEPGTPLIRPETRAPRPGPPAPRAAAPSPPRPPASEASRQPSAPPAPPARAPEPPPPSPSPPPPPPVAAAPPAPPDPPTPPPPPVAAPPPPPPPPPAPAPPEPPAVAAAPLAPVEPSPVPAAPPRPAAPEPRPSGPVAAAPAPSPSAPEPRPSPPATPPGTGSGTTGAAPPAPPADSGGLGSILGGRRFSLLPPQLETPEPPGGGPGSSGTGGTQREGSGTGESGTEREGQAAIPLNTPDPRYADYFLEIKRRIEANLVYPDEAARRNQSGQLLLEFVVRKNGSLRTVELIRSSGVGVLDRRSMATVKLAAPFPPIPDRLGLDTLVISANFTYVLERGWRPGGVLR